MAAIAAPSMWRITTFRWARNSSLGAAGSSATCGHSNLTDEDGAYLEIMTGCYTDNQPDFAFLAPDETKIFEQTWYGLTELPDLKNAEKDGALGFTLSGGNALRGRECHG